MTPVMFSRSGRRRDIAEALGLGLDPVGVQVQESDIRLLGPERPGERDPEPAAPSGDGHSAADQVASPACTQLGS